ncbi:MAG: hypothetical protein DKINENOH_03961 [bacterium]|nr:hypothetical protein [bacterium]
MTVRFTAALPAGPKTGTFKIDNNSDNASPTKNVPLSGNVLEPLQKTLVVTPESGEFGDKFPSETADISFELKNTGNTAFEVTGLSTEGGAFSLVGPPATPFTLQPGGTQDVTVRFTAALPLGPRTGTFKIDNNSDNASPTKNVSLSGNVVEVICDLSVDPISHNFGSVVIGNSRDKTFVLSNAANATTNCFGSAAIVEDTHFSIVSGAQFSISPGGSHELVVRFTCTEIGSHGATLRLSSNDPDSPLDVPLSGTCVEPIVANFVGTPLLGVTPLTVQFTDTSTGLITSWLWDFGDGHTSTEQNPQHTYDVQVDPKFTVSLTVTGPGGSDTETKVNYIEVLLALEVNIEAAPASGLAPLAVAFSSSSNLPISSYSWNFGDGGTSTDAHPAHTYLQPGAYTVTLVTETPLGRITTRKVNLVHVFDCFTKAPLSLVSGSPTYPGEGWDNAIDGDVDGWNGTVTADGNPPQAVFGFSDGNARMIDRVRLLTDTNVLFSSRWVKEFRVLVSTTGTADSDFSEVLAGVKTGGAWEDFTFPAAGAKFVKLVIDKPAAGLRQLGEFEVWEALDANPPDTTLSSIAVSSPHVADGEDAATITIVLRDASGAAITGKPSIAFKLFVSGAQNSVSAVTETTIPGTYQATLTSLTAEVKTVSVLLGCTRLNKTPAGELASTTFVPIPVQLASLVFVQGAEAYPGEGWDNAIDGDVEDWDGTTTISGTPAFGVFSFAGGATEKVAAVRLLTDTGVGFGSRWVRKFRILVSTSGTAAGNFTEVLQGELSGGGWQEFSMTPVSAKYVKLQIDTPASGFRQLGEFEVHVTGSGLAKSAAAEQVEEAGLPIEFALSQNYPNPFNPETVIRIELPASVPTRLELYDLQGRLVRRLVDKEMTAGVHNLKWDGTDAQGRRVSSGIYCYRLQAGSFVQIKRMTLLK